MKIPSNLPPLPEPPAGHRWEYRGTGAKIPSGHQYICGDSVSWDKNPIVGPSREDSSLHYYEAVPIETEPNYSDRAYQKSVLDAAWEGVPCQIRSNELSKWIDATLHQVLGTATNGHIRIKPSEPAPDPYAALKAAHAAGKVIQFKQYSFSIWTDCEDGCSALWFHFPVDCYRVKPTPITVPLEAADFPTFFWIRFRPGSPMVLVHSLDSSGVSYAGKTKEYEFTYQQLMDDGWEYSADRKTWKPCHKEVEE